MSDEIGRELLWSDLKPRTIVVIKPPGRPPGDRGHFTFWVERVTGDYVMFHSAVLHWSVFNFPGPDDTVVDDMGRKVTVFEYLGEA